MRNLARAVVILIAMVSGVRAETITVTHWGDGFYGAPYAVAAEKGFFKAHGVDITGFLTSIGGGTSVRNTLAGDLPYGEAALSAVLLAIKAGQPLKIISGGVESVADILWITQPDSDLKSLQDITGKKIAYTSPGSMTNILLLLCMKKAGIAPAAVHMLPAGGNGANLSAVLNHAVDAAMSSEPLWSENQSKVRALFWASDCTNPNITQSVGITTEDYAKTGGATLRGLIAARREGVEYLMAHPDESADITAKAFSGDPTLYRAVFRHLVKIGYWGDGRLDYDNMNRLADGMRLVNQLQAPVEWQKIVDSSFLPKEK